MSESKYTLKFPFKDAVGDLVREVTLRGRVKVGDIMYVAEHSPNEKLERMCLIGRMCGLDVTEMPEMDLEDYNAIANLVNAPKEEPAPETAPAPT